MGTIVYYQIRDLIKQRDDKNLDPVISNLAGRYIEEMMRFHPFHTLTNIETQDIINRALYWRF